MVRLSKMTWQLKVLVVAVEILRVSVYYKIGFQKLFMVIQEPDVCHRHVVAIICESFKVKLN